MEEIYSQAGMSNLFQAPDSADFKRELAENTRRKLRALRTLLIVWVVSFVVVLCWFTLSTL
jgi:hypothetical protein